MPENPILELISEEMLELGGVSSFVSRNHRELNSSYTQRQNNYVSSLLDVLNDHGLSFESDDNEQWENILTRQIFKYYVSMLNSVKIGCGGGGGGVFCNGKTSNVRTCKNANKSRNVKVARCALIKGKRDIGMSRVDGDHELMAVPRSLISGNQI